MVASSERILVSGSHGFIGQNLINFLELSDIDYDVISRNMYDDEINLASIISNSKCIIHLGGLIKGSKQDLHEANYVSTEKILKVMANLREKPTLVFASSFAVYGVQDKILDEDSVVEPRNIYGESKVEVEELIKRYSKEYRITAVLLRISNAYGKGIKPYTHSVVSTFVEQALNNSPITINGNGDQERDFIYIDDLLKALLKAVGYSIAKNEGKTSVINICSGNGISLNELVKYIEKIFNIKTVIEYINKESLESGCWIGNNNFAFNTLRWKPETSFADGLKISYEKK